MLRALGIALAVIASLLPACQSPAIDHTTRPGTGTQQTIHRIVSYRHSKFRVTTRVRYARHDGVPLGLDVYQPAERGGLPAVLDIHGGGWSSGSKEKATIRPLELAAHGFVVFVPDYRLACENAARPLCGYHYPAPVRDVRSGLRWVRANGARFDAATQSVGVVGSSAGGNLAQMLGVTGAVGQTRADAVVSWSGSAKLAHGERSSASLAVIARYIGCRLSRCRAQWKKAFPISHVTPGSAPMLLINSKRDPIVPARTARDMAEALQQNNVPVELRVLPGHVHAHFDSKLLEASSRWLHSHL